MPKSLTTDSLIKSVKRRAMIPESQKTFEISDFLEIINEEMSMNLLPVVLGQHEDYYLISEDVALVSGQKQYSIPYRAIAASVKDIHIRNSSGALYELTRIDSGMVSDYLGDYGGSGLREAFYTEGDTIVLVNGGEGFGGSSLVFSYYIQPNNLVENKYGAVIGSVVPANIAATVATGSITVVNNSNISNNDTINLGNNKILTAKTSGAIAANGGFNIGIDQATTVTNIINTINNIQFSSGKVASDGSLGLINLVSSNSGLSSNMSIVVSLAIPGAITAVNMTGGDDTKYRTAITLETLPTAFTEAGSTFDFVTHNSPHSILSYDLSPVSINGLIFTFNNEDLNGRLTQNQYSGNLPVRLQKGDYITVAGETIVPNLPVEVHPMLAQLAAVYCLESLNDLDGLDKARQKLQLMERNTSTLLHDRVENAPKKIVNRHGALRTVLGRRSNY